MPPIFRLFRTLQSHQRQRNGRTFLPIGSFFYTSYFRSQLRSIKKGRRRRGVAGRPINRGQSEVERETKFNKRNVMEIGRWSQPDLSRLDWTPSSASSPVTNLRGWHADYALKTDLSSEPFRCICFSILPFRHRPEGSKKAACRIVRRNFFLGILLTRLLSAESNCMQLHLVAD